MSKKLYCFAISLLLICSISLLFKQTMSARTEMTTAPAVFSLTDSGFNSKAITITKGTVVIIKNDGTKPHYPEMTLGWFHSISPVEAIPADTQWVSQPLIAGEWKIKDKLYPTHAAVLKVVENPDSKSKIVTNPKVPTGENFFDRVEEWFQKLFEKIFSKR